MVSFGSYLFCFFSSYYFVSFRCFLWLTYSVFSPSLFFFFLLALSQTVRHIIFLYVKVVTEKINKQILKESYVYFQSKYIRIYVLAMENRYIWHSDNCDTEGYVCSIPFMLTVNVKWCSQHWELFHQFFSYVMEKISPYISLLLSSISDVPYVLYFCFVPGILVSHCNRQRAEKNASKLQFLVQFIWSYLETEILLIWILGVQNICSFYHWCEILHT